MKAVTSQLGQGSGGGAGIRDLNLVCQLGRGTPLEEDMPVLELVAQGRGCPGGGGDTSGRRV